MGLFEDYLKVENDEHFYDKQVLGMKYWEFIRYAVYHEILTRKSGSMNLLKATTPKGLKAYILNPKYLKNYLGLSKIHKADLLIISHPRRTKQGDKFYNNFTDPIVDGISDEYKSVTLEEPCWCSLTASETSHLFPVATKNIYFTDLYELLFLLKKKIFKICHSKKNKQVLIEVDQMLDFFENRYNIDLQKSKSHFVDKIIYNYIMKSSWEKVIEKIKPKAVLLHYFPTSFKGIIVNICNEKNIPTIELQHGVITYSDPPEHKTFDVNKCFNVPKYLFAFGDKLVNRSYLTTKEEDIKCVGYPFFEQKLKESYELPPQLKENEKYILVISQDIVGKELSQFTSELADLLKDFKNYKIIYKYHPNELTVEYECLNKENIITLKKFGEDIYKYQYYSTIQIGSYSTSIYEGLAFGLPTIIVKSIKNSNQTIDTLSFMDKGVYPVDTPEEALGIILGEPLQPKHTDVEQLWKSDSIENVKKQLKKIIK